MMIYAESSMTPDKDPSFIAEAFQSLIDVRHRIPSSSSLVPACMYIRIRSLILHGIRYELCMEYWVISCRTRENAVLVPLGRSRTNHRIDPEHSIEQRRRVNESRGIV